MRDIDLPGDLPIPEPTDDTVPDGTQLPIGGEDEPNQDTDAHGNRRYDGYPTLWGTEGED
jgi:hypothetical protein